MSQNPEANDTIISEVISSLSSKDCYFIAYYNPNGYYKADFPKMTPYFIVYREEQVKTMKDLMDMFLEEHKQFEQLKDGMAWELFTGTRISPKLTLDEFKIGLRTEKVNGTKIFVYEKKGEWSDQAAVMSYLNASEEHNTKPYQAPFFIEDVQYYIYLPLNPKSNVVHVKQILQKQIQRNLTAKVDIDNIQIYFRKQEKTVPAQKDHLSHYIGSQKEKFIVRFKTKVPLKLPPKQNNTFIIIRGEGIEKNIMFDYDSIKDRKLINVLDELIPNTDKKLKKIALVLQGQLLRFNESFSKFEKIFKNSSTTTRHFIGYLINECLAFYYSYKILATGGKIDFEKILIKQQTNLEKRRKCDKLSSSRALSATQPHFKNTENVSTILYYTSEIKVHASDNKKQTIYGNLNRFMREYDFCDAEILSKEDHWEYKFAAQLYDQLEKIKALEKQTLWRGIRYNQKYKIGEEIHFEQFNSTSIEMRPALDFAETGLLMILNSKSAHLIKQYSVFQKQNEALVEPYSTWKVKHIWKLTKETIRKKKQADLIHLDEKTYQQWLKNQKKDNYWIDLIIFEEIAKPTMPQMKSTVYLWVDDKTGEGKQIWQNIESIKNTTVMIQLLTTAQLENWLLKHQKMVNDAQIELVMITNMTRVEGGKKEDKAGVYAIDAFYKHKPNGTVFVYIGWLQGTLNKLKQHHYVPNQNLKVSNKFEVMVNFLEEKGLKSK